RRVRQGDYTHHAMKLLLAQPREERSVQLPADAFAGSLGCEVNRALHGVSIRGSLVKRGRIGVTLHGSVRLVNEPRQCRGDFGDAALDLLRRQRLLLERNGGGTNVVVIDLAYGRSVARRCRSN